MILSEIELAIFLLVVQCLNQLRYRVPLKYVYCPGLSFTSVEPGEMQKWSLISQSQCDLLCHSEIVFCPHNVFRFSV